VAAPTWVHASGLDINRDDIAPLAFLGIEDSLVHLWQVLLVFDFTDTHEERDKFRLHLW
jgi:hypothetical protein